MISFSKFCLILLLIAGFGMFSQSKSISSLQKKQYQYSFTGLLDQQSISSLENKLASLLFVTTAKIKYKSDSHKGQVFLFTDEKVITSEGEKGFDLIELKKLLISSNLTPLELTTTLLN